MVSDVLRGISVRYKEFPSNVILEDITKEIVEFSSLAIFL